MNLKDFMRWFFLGMIIALGWNILTVLGTPYVLLMAACVWILVLVVYIILAFLLGRGAYYATPIFLLLGWICYAFGHCIGVEGLISLGLAPDLATHPFRWLLYPILGFGLSAVIALVVSLYFYIDSKYTIKTRLLALGHLAVKAVALICGIGLIVALI